MSPAVFPLPLDQYPEAASLGAALAGRARADPLNLVVTAVFLLAIVQTFLAGRLGHWAHRLDPGPPDGAEPSGGRKLRHPGARRLAGRLLHLLSEVEVVFAAWAVVLFLILALARGLPAAAHYFSSVNYTEPLFVVAVMIVAGSRPVLTLAEAMLGWLARRTGNRVASWWAVTLVAAPLLGSFITEPAAMTIAASVLARQFYRHQPPLRLRYATLGLLFVNISVGGTLTHFAAPPVLMVAERWGWGTPFMLANFGWKAALGIAAATALYGFIFRRDLQRLQAGGAPDERPAEIPGWVTLAHVVFLGLVVAASHYPPLFLGALLAFLAFVRITREYQERVAFSSPILVGLFLAGLVVHGGLQGWWLEPSLRRLAAPALFWGAALLTAGNDNAAITFLATLVPGLTGPMQRAVVAGAVTGGGLTVIANAPNPAGQNILREFFPDGIAPGRLLLGALVPTLVLAAAFLLL